MWLWGCGGIGAVWLGIVGLDDSDAYGAFDDPVRDLDEEVK